MHLGQLAKTAFVAVFAMSLFVTGCGNTKNDPLPVNGITEFVADFQISATKNEDGSYKITLGTVEGAVIYYLFYAQWDGVSDTEHENSEWSNGEAIDLKRLVEGKTYFAFARADDKDGKPLGKSNLVTLLLTPVIKSAAWHEEKVGFEVLWDAVPGAESYELRWTETEGTFPPENVIPTPDTGALIPTENKDAELFVQVTAKADTGDSVSSKVASTASGCGQSHTWPGKSAIWSFEHCDPANGVTVWNNTPNANGETLGGRSAAIAKLTFTVGKTTNWDIGSGDAFLIFANFFGINSKEVNWHFQAYNLGPLIETRLTTQRFDGSCARFCEQKSISRDVQFPNASTNNSVSYTFDCEWQAKTAPPYASCVVTKPNDPSFLYETGRVNTDGAYFNLNYIGVGANGYHGAGNYGWPGNTEVSNLQLTFFD